MGIWKWLTRDRETESREVKVETKSIDDERDEKSFEQARREHEEMEQADQSKGQVARTTSNGRGIEERSVASVGLLELLDREANHLSEVLSNVAEDSYATRLEIHTAQEFLGTLRLGIDSNEPIDLSFDERFDDDPSDRAYIAEERDLHQSALLRVRGVAEAFERAGYVVHGLFYDPIHSRSELR